MLSLINKILALPFNIVYNGIIIKRRFYYGIEDKLNQLKVFKEVQVNWLATKDLKSKVRLKSCSKSKKTVSKMLKKALKVLLKALKITLK